MTNSKPTSDQKPQQKPTASQSKPKAEAQADNKPASQPEEQQPASKKEEAPQIDYLAEIQKYKDNWMRAAAEAQNIKRRAEQDIIKAKIFSIESFSKDLIEVLESLHRASEAINEEQAANSEALKNAKEGIEITKKEMLNVFERHGIKRISPKGEPFNPAHHEAVSQIESELSSGTVVDVVRAGYLIKDRLIQAAMVVVAK